MFSATPLFLAGDSLDLPVMRQRVDSVLSAFFREKLTGILGLGLPGEAARVLEEFVTSGGKRLRPLLCGLGWYAATGSPPPEPVIRVAAALELFHSFALIHDDVIDASSTRRGRPTVHVALATRRDRNRGHLDAERAGINAAILVGDLALAWSDELLHAAGLTPPRLAAVLPVLDAMRTELMHGQYLDLTTTGLPGPDVQQALLITHFKTAKYTCERPMHVGAALADDRPALLRELSAYALPLGEAFQLRDDLLGVFGDPSVTGKSCLEDLRAGKNTVLVALALRDAVPGDAAELRSLLGDPGMTEAQAARIREILAACGARHQAEEMIAERHAEALLGLESPASIHPSAVDVLRALAESMTRRFS
jgi:geranylgeranyl diphosphate synthase, type I